MVGDLGAILILIGLGFVLYDSFRKKDTSSTEEHSALIVNMEKESTLVENTDENQ